MAGVFLYTAGVVGMFGLLEICISIASMDAIWREVSLSHPSSSGPHLVSLIQVKGVTMHRFQT